MIGIANCSDLLSHSATVEEVHELADVLARVVTIVREAGGLLPPDLVSLVEGAAVRPSVVRRLNEMQVAATAA